VDLARYHRLRAAYYRLEGQRCLACETVQFPSRPACRRCRARALEPCGFSAPYLVALVALEEGPRVAAQLTDVDAGDVTIGMPVEMVTRRIQERGPHGYLVYGYKFRPVLNG